MKRFFTLSIGITCLFFSSTAVAQLENYDTLISQYLTAPPESGFMLFQTPNYFPIGGLFQLYKDSTNDVDNDMEMVSYHTDSLIYFNHVKYKQTYKNLDVEGAGLIEHFDRDGSLSFTNAKLAVQLDMDVKADISSENIMSNLIDQLGSEVEYAWDDSIHEAAIQSRFNNPNATYYPTPKLLLAIDNYKDVLYEIPANRYTLAYKIKVVTLNPYEIKEYYLDANTGDIIKVRSNTRKTYGTCGAYGYGTNNSIDHKWFGGLSWHYRLIALDDTHNFRTRKEATTFWGELWEEMDIPTLWGANNTSWGNGDLTETSAHYFTQTAWDYYRDVFSRNGLDGLSSFLQIRTQLLSEDSFYAFDSDIFPHPRLTFGKTGIYDHCWEPSIVAHEYTHGITQFTCNLVYEYESGALDESFSDIMGITIQAKELDNNVTDWNIGNHVATLPQRSLSAPNSAGRNWTGNFDSSGEPIFGSGQPDTYLGTFFFDDTDFVDRGGVHINSGVQNHWYHILANGQTSTNDLGDYYHVTGIGMDDASSIIYLAHTSFIMSASQYTDNRVATIQAAIQLFGWCSQQHKSTVDAWYAVGVGDHSGCAPLGIEESIQSISIYPNPASTVFSISTEGLNVTDDVRIYSISGNLVKTINSSSTMSIDISDLSSGIYIVRLNVNDRVKSRKLIIKNYE
ncbi:MAG: M4 family metallopeptidase [Crocinitomicaceae bacterium]